VAEAVVAVEIVTEVLPFQAAVTYVPETIPLPEMTEPVLIPVASATTSVTEPEA
jgi:hypothetical protein